MPMGSPTSVAAAPDASNCEISTASTSGGRHRKIIPMGKLILPTGGVVGFLPASDPVPVAWGRTIRCVARAGPVRVIAGVVAGATGRGITIG